jgi:hypothetical protein
MKNSKKIITTLEEFKENLNISDVELNPHTRVAFDKST